MKEAYQAKFNKALEVAEDLGGLCAGRPVHHRPDGAECLWRRPLPQGRQPRQPVRLPAAVPRQRRQSSSTTSMKAQLASDAGMKTLKNMIAANKASIPGNNELDAVSLWAAFLQGKVAMIYSWPPTGRMAAGYSQSDKAINFIPQSQIAGKVGYAVVPGNPEHATGYNKALSADSPTPRPPICSCSGHARRRCRWPAACCPMRCAIRTGISHFKSELYGALWPDAPRSISSTSTTRPMSACSTRSCPAAQDYFLSIDRMCTVGLGRRRSEGGARDGRRRVGRDHRASRRRLAEGVLHRVPEAAGRHRRQYGREARHGSQTLTRQAAGELRRAGGRLLACRRAGTRPR